MRYLEDKRRCPGCGEPLYRQSYLMERNASENVLTWNLIAWIACIAVVALIISTGS